MPATSFLPPRLALRRARPGSIWALVVAGVGFHAPAAAEGRWLPWSTDKPPVAAQPEEQARHAEAQASRLLLLERRVQAVRASLDELQRSMDTLDRKLDGTLQEMSRLARISRDLSRMQKALIEATPPRRTGPADQATIAARQGKDPPAPEATPAPAPIPGPEVIEQMVAQGAFDQVIATLEPLEPLAAGPGWDAATRALWLGRAHLGRRDFARATDHYRRMLELGPGHPLAAQAMLGLGVSQVHLPDPSGARATLVALLARFPQAPEASHARALLFFVVGRSGH